MTSSDHNTPQYLNFMNFLPLFISTFRLFAFVFVYLICDSGFEVLKFGSGQLG